MLLELGAGVHLWPRTAWSSLPQVEAPGFRQHEKTSGYDKTALQGHLAMNKEHFRAMLGTTRKPGSVSNGSFQHLLSHL